MEGMVPTPILTKYEKRLVFHDLWSSCVNTPDYKKKIWKDVEHQLLDAGIISSIHD